MNPHEKLAMEFFSPPGPSAREWRTGGNWADGAKVWPKWNPELEYEIRLKPQTITLPERTIPKPLDVGELVDAEAYWMVDLLDMEWICFSVYQTDEHHHWAERGLFYPHTDQGKADAIAAAKAMCGWEEQPE